jgi:SNF2 family DNA or RNA helicase
MVRPAMKEICLKRTKEMQCDGEPLLRLPERTVRFHTLDLNPSERALYNIGEFWPGAPSPPGRPLTYNVQLLHPVNDLADGKLERIKDGSEKKETDIMVLPEITRLRQICNHPGQLGKILDDDSFQVRSFLWSG